jgi:hypothetical protein
MSRRWSSLLISLGLAACVGLPPATRPVFFARAMDSASAPEPQLVVERNSIVLTAPAATVTGCSTLAGEYVREGGEIAVDLKQVAAQPCPVDDQRPYITRVGPLPPGAYDVRVRLDGRTLVESHRLSIQ